jgi:lysylphosphatidylglycerol synthetase-like protein (DUF2156 family)
LSTAVFTSRKSGLTLLQAQQWAGSLTVLAAFGACAASGELGPFLMLLFPLGLIGAHFYGARVAGKAEWAWTLFLGAALIFFAFAVVAGQLDIVLAAARFALLLCFHRLWHRKGERDELLLLLLSLLLLCASAALSAELLFGVGFIFYSITGTWALALTHLRFEIEAGRGPEGSAALLQSRRLATPALLGALAALSLLGLVGGLLHLPAGHHRRPAAALDRKAGRRARRPGGPARPRHHRRRPARGAARAAFAKAAGQHR